jgi:hypothetical protein
MATGDSRLSLEERYTSRDEYLAKVTATAKQLVADGFLLPQDLQDPINQAMALYDWAVQTARK